MLSSERSFAAKPYRPAAKQIADDDAVLVTLSDRDFIDADDAPCRRARAVQLFAHVLLFEVLDGMPVEAQFGCDLPDDGLATALADVESEPLGVEGIVGQPVEAFVLHAGTPRARYSSKEEGKIDALVATGEIAYASSPLVVVMAVRMAALTANRFFRRRWSETTTAIGSPNRPRRRWLGTQPGNRYKSRSCLNLAILES